MITCIFEAQIGWQKVLPGIDKNVRIIRNTIRTFAPDGLYWVVMNKNSRGRYPKAALVGAPIYHYGHVRSIAAMQAKNQRVGKYWGHDHPLFNGYQIDPEAVVSIQDNTLLSSMIG